MLSRLYVHNFRCFENFELALGERRSALLLGKNGAGKSTAGAVLEILQRIACGTNRVGDLLGEEDLTRYRREVPMRFEIEARIGEARYRYVIVLELPLRSRELRVAEEFLSVDGREILSRTASQVRLSRLGDDHGARFALDWHLAALPIVQEQSATDPLSIFRLWLADLLVLRPVPASMRGDSDSETLRPDPAVSRLGAWFSGLVASEPSVYTTIDHFLKQVLPDLLDIKNPRVGRDSRSMRMYFAHMGVSLDLPFEKLSDGEKSFVVCALVLAAKDVTKNVLCFWDEPDKHLALSEVGFALMALRRAFNDGEGQLIVTSHNPEVVRRFSDDNTFLLQRTSHLEPTVVRSIASLRDGGTLPGNLVEALLRGDIDA